MRRRLRGAALAGAAALTLAGCTGGIYNVSLPGGPNLGSHPYTVTAQFTDVLDLVPQASVRVNDVAVGEVRTIGLIDGGRLAAVTLELNGDVHLPANATATISQTSLLGEKFVALASPAQPQGELHNGAVITVAHTQQAVQFEQVFGALSLLLNGGGVGQLHEIVVELNKALGGDHTVALHSLLQDADAVVHRIAARRGDIVAALAQVNTLSRTLNANSADLTTALRDLPAGLRVLARQRARLVAMLDALGRLSRTTVHTVRASGRAFVSDLRSLAPTLRRLAAAGQDLPNSLQLLLTYPFPDSVLRAIRGDYLNAFITTNLNTPGGSVVRLDRHATADGVSAPPAMLPPVDGAAPGLPQRTIVTTPSPTSGTR